MVDLHLTTSWRAQSKFHILLGASVAPAIDRATKAIMIATQLKSLCDVTVKAICADISSHMKRKHL